MPRLTAAELDAELEDADLDTVPEPSWRSADEPEDAVRDFYSARARWHRYFEHGGDLCSTTGCGYDPTADVLASAAQVLSP